MAKMSKPEAEFALHCRAHKLNPVPEFRFCPTRKFRADFAFPAHMILIEIEGGVWLGANGGHTSGKGLSRDCEKASLAALLGYRLFRFTPDMVKSGEAVQMVIEAISRIAANPALTTGRASCSHQP